MTLILRCYRPFTAYPKHFDSQINPRQFCIQSTSTLHSSFRSAYGIVAQLDVGLLVKTPRSSTLSAVKPWKAYAFRLSNISGEGCTARP
jgi:hypothetical protein